MDFVKLIAGLALTIPVCMLFTSTSWLIGLFRGRSRKPRFHASWIVAGRGRRWVIWYLTGTVGMMLAGAMLGRAVSAPVGMLFMLAAIALWAVAQYCAFWLGYLLGDKRHASERMQDAARAAAQHEAWAAERAAQAVGAEPDWV